jgi:hypothetical protein
MPNVSDSVINPAIDNVSDWSNEIKTYLLAQQAILENMQIQIGENLRTIALSLQDSDRIADNIAIMRNEMSNPTGS